MAFLAWALSLAPRSLIVVAGSLASPALALRLLATITIGLPLASAQTLTVSQQKANTAYRQGMELLREKQYQEALERFKQAELYTPNPRPICPKATQGKDLPWHLAESPKRPLLC
jgi:hypothetical protein